jgi:hypothetical protein
MAFDDLAKAAEDQIALVVDHPVQGANIAQTAHDFQLLFMQGVAVQIAFADQRMLYEPAGMEGADGFVMGDAGGNDFAPAGKARRDMGFHQTGGDFQISLGKAAVDLDGDTTFWRHAKIHLIDVFQREMVLDPDIFHFPRIAHQLGQFIAFVWAMQPCGNQNGDVIQRDSLAGKRLDHRAQKQMAGHRQVEVADQDAGRAFAAREFR